MSHKNLVQRIRGCIVSFMLGAAISAGITYKVVHQPVQSVHETKEDRYYENPFYMGVYDRIDWNLDGYLDEIRVDKDGDGRTDEVITFGRKRPDTILSRNAVGIYQGGWASSLLPDSMQRTILLSGDLSNKVLSGQEYMDAVRRILRNERYPTEILDDMQFKEF